MTDTAERFIFGAKTVFFVQAVSNLDRMMDLSALADFHLVASQGGFGKASRAKLAAERPSTLACMHGSAWQGDGAKLLLALGERLAESASQP